MLDFRCYFTINVTDEYAAQRLAALVAVLDYHPALRLVDSGSTPGTYCVEPANEDAIAVFMQQCDDLAAYLQQRYPEQ